VILSSICEPSAVTVNPAPVPTPPDSWGEPRTRTVTWHDPLVTAAGALERSGLETMQAIRDGVLPPAPIAMLMQFDLRAFEEGRVEFGCLLDESAYNPIGVVHGGLVCTLLDTVAGCAVHTTLRAGVGYTSIELKVNYLRAVHASSGPLTAIGRVVKPGRRVAFAEGEVLDAAGRTVATASSSLLVFPVPA
jgi:uncharacterized protein (TIGR00369 family)